MILVFDLDDTLYNEVDFVKSGFSSVSNYLSNTYKLPSTFEDMCNLLSKDGRGQIFNKILDKYNFFSIKRLKKCISIYRYHKPNIRLFDSAERCLQRFSAFTKYIVTDGNKLVQANKIKALNIMSMFTGIYITRNYGIDKEKPSPYCFLKIQARENSNPQNIVYIGDNSNKDFVGIKKLGFKTVRIKTGFYKDILVSKEYEAEFVLSSLDEIDSVFLSNLEK